MDNCVGFTLEMKLSLLSCVIYLRFILRKLDSDFFMHSNIFPAVNFGWIKVGPKFIPTLDNGYVMVENVNFSNG